MGKIITDQECFKLQAEAYRTGRSQMAKIIITTYNNLGWSDKEKLNFLKTIAEADFIGEARK